MMGNREVKPQGQACGPVEALDPRRIAQACGPGILDHLACCRLLFAHLHPQGPACPHCGEAPPESTQPRWWGGGQIKCPACGSKYSARSGTVLSGCRLSPSQLVLLLTLTGLGIEPVPAAKLVGTSGETVRQWIRKVAS